MQPKWSLSLADRITRCAHQVQGILSFFYGGSIAPETLETVILPSLEALQSELSDIAHTFRYSTTTTPIDVSDPYLRRHADRWRHPALRDDCIWRVASYLNWLEPGQQTVPPEVRQRVIALLQQVTQTADALN